MSESHASGRPDISSSISGEFRAMGLRSAIARRVPALLDRDEPVSFIGMCTFAASWWREALSGYACVVTDRRLLFLDTKYLIADPPTAEEQPSIAYRDIRSIEPKFGLLESKLTVELADETVQLTSMRRKGARAVTAAIRQHTAR